MSAPCQDVSIYQSRPLFDFGRFTQPVHPHPVCRQTCKTSADCLKAGEPSQSQCVQGCCRTIQSMNRTALGLPFV